MEAMFHTPDIECAGCAASIEKAIGREPGVEAVSVDVPTKQVTIRYSEAQTDKTTLTEALTEVGFPPQTA